MTIDLLDLVKRSQSLRPNTKRAYSNAVRQWLDFAGETPAAWTVENAQAFYDALLANGTSVEHANNMITGGLTFAFKRAAAIYPGKVVDIMAAVDRRKVNRNADDGQRALIAPQVNALRAACFGTALADMRDLAMVDIEMFTGMRRMSLVSIDLKRVRVYDTFVTLNIPLKGGDTYNAPLDVRAWGLTKPYRDALTKLRPAIGPQPMFPAISQRLGGGGLITTVGDALTEDGAYRALGRRADKAHLSNFHPHVFRHTFSTWCQDEKHRIEDYLVEVVTGHKSNRGLVHRVYTDETQLFADVSRRCYEAIASRLTL